MTNEMQMDSGALIFATLADVYLSSGMVDEAISILKDGLLRNPTYTLAKVILGRAYYIKGDVNEALKTLESVYEEAKDSENLNLYLGYCYGKLGEYDKAMNYYEETLKINPQSKEAKRELDILKSKEEIAEPEEEVTVEEAELPKEEKEEESLRAILVRGKKTVLPVTEPEVVTPEVKPEEKPEAKPEEPAEEVIAPPVPLESLNEPIKKLLSIEMVKGAFICSKDGLLIQSYYESRDDIEEICALIADIYTEADELFLEIQAGELERCIIDKDDETLCVINAGDTLLTVVTQHEAKPGLVFVYARKIMENIKEVLG